jgi:hypothetical protein
LVQRPIRFAVKEQVAEKVPALRERHGFGRPTVLEPCTDAFAPVAELLRGARASGCRNTRSPRDMRDVITA